MNSSKLSRRHMPVGPFARSVRLAVGIAVASLSACASAQESPGFLGFSLGSRLEGVECPRSGPGVQFPPVCLVYVRAASWRGTSGADHFQIIMDADKMPDWAGSFYAVTINGQIVELSLMTRGAKVQADAYEAAVKRLGKPAQSERRTWTHRQLGNVNSIAASWKGATWQGSFEGIAAQLETGVLTISRSEDAPKKPVVPL